MTEQLRQKNEAAQGTYRKRGSIALEQPKQEPSQWRDMIVATLVREGVNKHRARELADHFAAERNNG